MSNLLPSMTPGPDDEIKVRASHLSILAREYGGVDNIPIDVLTTIGYVRDEVLVAGALTNVYRPKEKPARHSKPENIEKIPTDLHEKYSSALPFESVKFDTPAGGDVIVTIERATVCRELGELWIDEYSEVPQKILNSTELHTLRGTNFEWLMKTALDYIKNFGGGFTTFPEREIIPPHNPADGTDLWSDKQEINKLLEALDKYKAKAGDPDSYRLFNNKIPPFWTMEMRYAESGGASDEELEDFDVVLISDEAKTKADAGELLMGTLEQVKEFLIAKGLAEFAEEMPERMTIDDARMFFNDAKTKLRAQTKRVNPIDISDHNLNDDGKKLAAVERARRKQDFKAKLNTLQQLIDMFSLSEYIAAYFRKRVDKIQKYFTKTKSAGEVSVTIDAKYDPVKDRDPGSFSEDCTEGKPLPFEDLGVPVYNLKVYAEGQYVGNIYLVTVLDENGQKTWHIEAVQVKSRSIDWDSFPANFVNLMSQKANEQGIGQITINHISHQVSNYDYIGKAFTKYARGGDNDEELSETVHVLYPDNPNPGRYSDFQGTGEALVLWKN